MNKLIPLLVLASIISLSGCATITGDTMQAVAITAETLKKEPLSKVDCTLKNEKGSWVVVAPNTVSVHKASGDLIVECTKKGQPKGMLRAISRAGAGMAGNILIGGGIGALIDHNKGTAYNYPNNLPVVMGKSAIIDRRTSEKSTAN